MANAEDVDELSSPTLGSPASIEAVDQGWLCTISTPSGAEMANAEDVDELSSPTLGSPASIEAVDLTSTTRRRTKNQFRRRKDPPPPESVPKKSMSACPIPVPIAGGFGFTRKPVRPLTFEPPALHLPGTPRVNLREVATAAKEYRARGAVLHEQNFKECLTWMIPSYDSRYLHLSPEQCGQRPPELGLRTSSNEVPGNCPSSLATPSTVITMNTNAGTIFAEQGREVEGTRKDYMVSQTSNYRPTSPTAAWCAEGAIQPWSRPGSASTWHPKRGSAMTF
eukprot:CAMPEP_0115832534 /NCGR_PEP_ID=MMETSP0287-20121206/2709_1 /TAXON_ID=412157 /ORGANISM="Chrysochromulina rotalis, Strain UIO044" /LENGTH=279 /DNA_ID=CAMNT_0003285925 /DNA_START=68 /DNA_END=908 /DNA_ORIENTATION=-